MRSRHFWALSLLLFPLLTGQSDCESPDEIPPEDAQACAAIWQGEVMAMGYSESEAGTVLLLPNEAEGYQLILPDTGEGYAMLEVPDWHVEMMIYHAPGVSVEVSGGEKLESAALTDACDEYGMMAQKKLFHEWGSYRVKIVGEPGSEVWFMSFVVAEGS